MAHTFVIELVVSSLMDEAKEKTQNVQFNTMFKIVIKAWMSLRDAYRMTFVHNSATMTCTLNSNSCVVSSIHLIENDFNLNSTLLRRFCCNLNFWFQISNSSIFKWKFLNSLSLSQQSVDLIESNYMKVLFDFDLLHCEECKRVWKYNDDISMIEHFCHRQCCNQFINVNGNFPSWRKNRHNLRW